MVLTAEDRQKGPPVLAYYRIRIEERLDRETAAVFEGLEIAIDGETTVISGALDQAALHGLLERVRMLGLELVEARRVPGPTGEDATITGLG